MCPGILRTPLWLTTLSRSTFRSTQWRLGELFGRARGTIEFDTPAGGQISVLGIRTTPNGSNNTLTTIPALANIGTGGGSVAHIATGNGWQTTFVLGNAGTSAAQVNLGFFADCGAPLSLPLSFPQSGGGASTQASTVNQSLAAGATLIIQSLRRSPIPCPRLVRRNSPPTGRWEAL